MMMLRRQKPHAIDASSSLERDVLASDAPRKASSPAGVDTVWLGSTTDTVVTVRNRAHSFVADHAGRVFSTRSTVDPSWRRRLRGDPLYAYSSFMYTLLGLQMLAQSLYCAAATPHFNDEIAVAEAAWVIVSGFISYWSDTHMLCLPSIAHVADRCNATALFFFQVVKFSWFSSATPLAELAWVWGLGLGFGAVVKGYDSRCMRKHDVESYRASHILWHFQMPLVFILYNVYRVWRVCGEVW